MNVCGLLLPWDGAMSKADRAPWPRGCPHPGLYTLASLQQPQDIHSSLGPGAAFSPVPTLEGSVSSDPLVPSILLLGSQTFILLCAPCLATVVSFAEPERISFPAALKHRALLLLPHQGPRERSDPGTHARLAQAGAGSWSRLPRASMLPLSSSHSPSQWTEETGCDLPSLFHVPCDLTTTDFQFQNPKGFSAHCRKSFLQLDVCG